MDLRRVVGRIVANGDKTPRDDKMVTADCFVFTVPWFGYRSFFIPLLTSFEFMLSFLLHFQDKTLSFIKSEGELKEILKEVKYDSIFSTHDHNNHSDWYLPETLLGSNLKAMKRF